MKAKKFTKKLLSLILSVLMVITIVPVSVLPAVAEDSVAEQSTTATKGAIKAELSLAAGESYGYTLDLTEVDKTQNLVLEFNAHQRAAVDGALTDNAVLSINGSRTLRVTTGNGMHIWDEAAGAVVSGSDQWNGCTSAQNVTVTVDFTNGVVNFIYNNRNVNLTSLDLSGDTLTFKFGGANTSALTVKNIKLLDVLYSNNFDSAADVARGTCGDATNVVFNAVESALHISHNNWNYANAYWETSVNLNGTDGNIILKTTMDADAVQSVSGSMASGAILTVNGKVIVQNSVLSDNSNRYTVTLGGKTEIRGCSSGKEEVTLIINRNTGTATMYFEQNEATVEYPKLTIVEGIELGAIGETLSVKYGTNRHPNFYVYSLSVQQEKGEVIEGGGDEPVASSTLLEVGRIAYDKWSNGTKNEYTVKTNKTSGDITIVFTPERNNWYSDGNNLLSVNGVSLIKTYGVSGSYNGYYLGTTAVKTSAANVITVVINPSTGAASISDVAGNTGTANVGAIGDGFTMVVNQDQNNGWELTSIVVTQVVGETVDSSDPNPNTLYANNFDSDEDVARGTCGDANVAFNADKDALLISHNGYKYLNSYWEDSIELNGTDGLITLKTTIDADSNNPPVVESQAEGIILTVNGKPVIQNEYGGKIIKIGDETEIKGCAGGFKEEITLVIDPETGKATLTLDQTAANAKDGSYPKTTVVEGIGLGPIGETLSVRYGTNRHTHFYVYSLSVEQESGGEIDSHTCEYTTTVTAATCITPEFTRVACSGCGSITNTVTAPVLGHTWGTWTKSNGVATRSCTVCGKSQSKTVGAADNSKNLLAIGDSLTFGLKTPNTVNDSWARYVSDSLGMRSYKNYAVAGSEVYQWYSLLTGENAPNNQCNVGYITVTQETLIEEIENAGVVAFSLGSNDMLKNYIGHRNPKDVQETLVKIVDAIHSINPDAIVISVGYTYGVSMFPGEENKKSDRLFVEFNNLMTEALNSEAYNSFAYYVDVSDVMSTVSLMDTDKVHPTAEGQEKIADHVIEALESLDKADKVTWEYVSSYVNHFDGTAPAASVVSWGEKGTDGVLTVEPLVDPHANKINVGSVAFPGKTIVTFKFNIPELPESGSINIFHDRILKQNYIRVFSEFNEETQETEFFASVGNNNEGNSVVKIEENTWYDVTILFAENTSSYSRVYVNNSFVGTVEGKIIGNTAGNGFANFCGCSSNSDINAATYQIDDFTASTVADDTLVHAYGIQRSEPSDLLYDVRFILSVADIYNDESAIGMDITVNYGDESRTKTGLEVKTVFEGFFENYGEDIVSAGDLGGQYIAAIVVEDIPVEYESVEFVVSPYALVDGVKYYSKTMTATVYSKK